LFYELKQRKQISKPVMVSTPELTEAIESIILEQLTEECYPSQIQVPGLNNEFDPWQRQAKQQLIEELVTRKKVHRVQHPGRRTPGGFRRGPGPQ
jgi:hypothetical protein